MTIVQSWIHSLRNFSNFVDLLPLQVAQNTIIYTQSKGICQFQIHNIRHELVVRDHTDMTYLMCVCCKNNCQPQRSYYLYASFKQLSKLFQHASRRANIISVNIRTISCVISMASLSDSDSFSEDRRPRAYVILFLVCFYECPLFS